MPTPAPLVFPGRNPAEVKSGTSLQSPPASTSSDAAAGRGASSAAAAGVGHGKASNCTNDSELVPACYATRAGGAGPAGGNYYPSGDPSYYENHLSGEGSGAAASPSPIKSGGNGKRKRKRGEAESHPAPRCSLTSLPAGDNGTPRPHDVLSVEATEPTYKNAFVFPSESIPLPSSETLKLYQGMAVAAGPLLPSHQRFLDDAATNMLSLQDVILPSIEHEMQAVLKRQQAIAQRNADVGMPDSQGRDVVEAIRLCRKVTHKCVREARNVAEASWRKRRDERKQKILQQLEEERRLADKQARAERKERTRRERREQKKREAMRVHPRNVELREEVEMLKAGIEELLEEERRWHEVLGDLKRQEENRQPPKKMQLGGIVEKVDLDGTLASVANHLSMSFERLWSKLNATPRIEGVNDPAQHDPEEEEAVVEEPSIESSIDAEANDPEEEEAVVEEPSIDAEANDPEEEESVLEDDEYEGTPAHALAEALARKSALELKEVDLPAVERARAALARRLEEDEIEDLLQIELEDNGDEGEVESALPALRPLVPSLYSGDGVAAPVHAPRAAEASFPPPLDCRYDQLRSQYSAVGMAQKKVKRKGKLTDIPLISAFQSTLRINKKVTTSKRTALPAHTALWYDVVMFGRGDACAAFTSREHFDACLERDRRVVLAKHPLSEDNGSNIQSQIPSLGEWCIIILEQIRSRLGYSKEAKNRLAELERILRVEDDGEVPDLHMLWLTGADESESGETDSGETDSDEPDLGESESGETDSGETDSDEPDLGEPDLGETDSGETDLGESNSGERLLDVRELFCSIGDVYSGSRHNVRDAKIAALTAPRFQMKTADQNELRLIDKRQTIRAGLKRDFPLHYGSPFDPNLTIGPDGYRPFFMLNTAEYHVDAEVKAKTLQRMERERQSSYALLREEQGEQQFEAQDESTRGGYRTFEGFEDEHSDETRKQVIQYNKNLDWFHDECLSIERLKQFQSVDGDVAATPYATVLQEVHDALRLVNQHLHLDLRLAQVIGFSEEAYTSRPDALIAVMVGRIYHHLAPGDTCRHQFCNCKISERIRSAPEHRESHGDHTREAEEIYGRKDKKPSSWQNLDKKLAETRKTLPVSRCCHDVTRREDRGNDIPLSRLRSIRRQPGTTHRTGKQVVMSQRFLLLFCDLVASGALQSVCPLDSDDMQCILVNHTGLTFEECTEKPLWVWDECDDMQARYNIVNSILNGVLKRYSERCANPDCPDPDIVNRSTFGLKGDEWDHAYEEDKDMDCSRLRNRHPIQFINEILRACNVTCCRCHGVKTALNNLGIKGQVFDWLLAELDFSGVETR